MKKALVLHPFLLAVYGVLSLMANNLSYVEEGGLRTLFFSLVGSILIFLVLKFLLKDGLKAGLLATGLIFAVLSYGHIQNLLPTIRIKSIVIQDEFLLFPIYAFALFGWTHLILRKSKNLRVISDYLNWVGIILIAFPVYSIATASRNATVIKDWYPELRRTLWREAGLENPENLSHSIPVKKPDIYYLVLDAYTSASVLKELYGFDNTEFLEFLRQKDFYVAENSQANYIETELSIASALNMAHLTTVPDFFDHIAQNPKGWKAKDVSSDLIRHNYVVEILKRLGYTFVVFDSGFAPTQIKEADQYLVPPGLESVNGMQLAFEIMLLDSSLGKFYLQLAGEKFGALQSLFEAHRRRVLYALGHIPDFASREGSYFVFAHIVTPHTPFVFGPNGEELSSENPYTLLDAQPGREENVAMYRGQVEHVNRLLMKAIDRILEESSTPPIIILQGDHSSRTYRMVNPPLEIKKKLLFPILNAYLIPNVGDNRLYSTISPVNSLRVVLNAVFNFSLDLLPDVGYILDDGRTNFLDGCQVYGSCSP